MEDNLFTIYDTKAESYGVIFNTPTLGLAERLFTDQVNNPEMTMYHHPEDFTLFYLGTYSRQDAKFNILETPKSLVTAIAVKRQET